MSNLKKIADEDRESKFGYVYAVSGPGKSSYAYRVQNCLHFKFSNSRIIIFDITAN